MDGKEGGRKEAKLDRRSDHRRAGPSRNKKQQPTCANFCQSSNYLFIVFLFPSCLAAVSVSACSLLVSLLHVVVGTMQKVYIIERWQSCSATPSRE